jgi:S1-C subfamily serine protease
VSSSIPSGTNDKPDNQAATKGTRLLVAGLVTDDPLKTLRAGEMLTTENIVFNGSDATDVPQDAKDWSFFEGALLTVGLRIDGMHQILGTAVVVAPGLAVTATHVFDEHLPGVRDGSIGLWCGGVASAGLNVWEVSGVNFAPQSDIAFLSIRLVSELPEGRKIRKLPLSTRTVLPGDKVSVIGFRIGPLESSEETSFLFSGQMFIAAGHVVETHPHMRDPLLMPYPTIEIACGAVGGMSGGAVIDDTGHVVGVLSKSFETEDHRGPSSASWIVGGLNRRVSISWPPGLYPENVHVLDIDHRILTIQGREHMKIIDDNNYQYVVWN